MNLRNFLHESAKSLPGSGGETLYREEYSTQPMLTRLLVLALLLGGLVVAASWASTPIVRVQAAIDAAETRTLVWTARGLDGLTHGAFLAFAGGRCASQAGTPGRMVAADLPKAEPWAAVAPGIRFRRVSLANGMVLNEVEVDPRQATLEILYARDQGRRNATVPELAVRAGAVAAVNASYFGSESEPLGYLKAGGRVIVPDVATGAAFTGVFQLSGGRPSIVARADFDPSGVDTALQAGPRLVAGGVFTQGLRERRSFRQTGVAVTRGGRVVLYATDGSYSGLTWQETRRILTGPARQGGVDPTDVLNFDGGSSSQMYVALPAADDIRTGFPTRVPVALGVFSSAR